MAGLSEMVTWSWGLINGAADVHDEAAAHTWGFVACFPPGGAVNYLLLPFWPPA